MKKGIILNLKNLKLLNYVTYNKILILFFVLYILGLVLSVFWLSDNCELTSEAKSYLSSYFSLHNSIGFFNKFLKIFLRYFVVALLYFLSGTSMFAIAITPFLILWQGVWCGALITQLYSLYGIYGVAFNAMVMIPPTVILVMCCIFAAKHSLDFSISLVSLTLPRAKATVLYTNFKKYCVMYLLILGVLVLCTLLEIVLNNLFLNFFNF